MTDWRFRKLNSTTFAIDIISDDRQMLGALSLGGDLPEGIVPEKITATFKPTLQDTDAGLQAPSITFSLKKQHLILGCFAGGGFSLQKSGKLYYKEIAKLKIKNNDLSETLRKSFTFTGQQNAIADPMGTDIWKPVINKL